MISIDSTLSFTLTLTFSLSFSLCLRFPKMSAWTIDHINRLKSLLDPKGTGLFQPSM